MPTLTAHQRELVVFISSTYADLEPYRTKVEEALTRVQTGFRSMRFFGSKEGEPLDQCLSKVRESNYYVGIIGHRYGSVHPTRNASYTELEYEESKSQLAKRRIYIASATVPLQADQQETDDKRARLDSFKQKLKAENTVVEFSSPDDLATKIIADILMSLPQKQEFAQYAEQKYLPATRRMCASISFLGLDIQSMKRHRDVKLEKVYIHSKFAPYPTTGDIAAMAWRAEMHFAPVSFPRPSLRPLEIGDLLRRYNSIVLLGDAGAGKSTLAKHVVVALVDGLTIVPAHMQGALPIRVPLRTYADYRHRAGGIGISLLDFIRAFARTELQLDSLPEGFFEFYLERKQCLVIFDGLDEIFDLRLREDVRSDIVAFTQTSYPGNKTFVTSRKIGYDDAPLPPKEFDHFQVLPFDDKQIREYIRKWYSLEETDRAKRKAETGALEQACKSLPGELVRNPLLLSLIVILFRSGCTLPDSKLEIYRSCVGTLTEKWDAAGKRLEMPPEFNLVRDKKGAFARIAYWMYKQQSAGAGGQIRVNYTHIVAELARHLSVREFKGRESEAEQAAGCFLDYAAKRSIFVGDRFVHKTFHEFFAALYLYRSFCVGHTADEVFSEIHPYLGSGYWALVLELLFQMIDEQSGELLDTLLTCASSEVGQSPAGRSTLLHLPLLVLGQLQNVGATTAESMIELGVSICSSITVPELWFDTRGAGSTGAYARPEEPPHYVLAKALADLPTRFQPARIKYVKRAAAIADGRIDMLLPVAALCVERAPAFGRAEEVIPNWENVRAALACQHLAIFYHIYPSLGPLQEIEQFVELIGEHRLFHTCRQVFDRIWYASLVESILYGLKSQSQKEAYGAGMERFLGSSCANHIIEGMLEYPNLGSFVVDNQGEIPLSDFQHVWADPRRYFVDWFLLSRIGYKRPGKGPLKSVLKSRLDRILRSGVRAQKFYAALLLGNSPPPTTAEGLGIPPQTHNSLLHLARSAPPPRRMKW